METLPAAAEAEAPGQAPGPSSAEPADPAEDGADSVTVLSRAKFETVRNDFSKLDLDACPAVRLADGCELARKQVLAFAEVSAISAGAHMRNAERSPYERAPEMTCDPPTAITVSSDPCIAHETLASTTALSVPTCTACVHASPTAVA